MENKEFLEVRFKQVNEMQFSKRKYYHLKSVGNFIYHINVFFGKSEYEEIVSQLIAYINYIEEETIQNRNESFDAFNIYLRPIGKLYEKSAGFEPNVRTWIFVFWLLFFCSILLALKVSVLFFMILFVVFLYGYFYYRRKRNSKRVYGYFW